MEERAIKILLVEDEEAHAELVLRAFESHHHGFSVSVAASLAEARDYLARETPDLAICDYLLPDGHGIDLVASSDGIRPFPMVLLTSHGDEKLAVEAMKAGVLDYIVKSEETFAQTPHIAERALRQWTHIIERNKAEQALKINEARYRELFDNMRSGVAVFKAVEDGRDFLFTDHNKAGESISQVPKEEVIGRKVLEVVPGIKDIGLFDTFQRVWKTGMPERHPISLYQDDHLRIWIDCHVYKLPTGEIVSVYDDVTQRRESEEELQRWAHLFEHAEWGLVASIADHETLDLMNPAYARMHGYTVAELTGLPVTDVYAPEVREEIQAQIRLIDEKGHHTYESLHVRKDGTVFPVLVDGTSVKDEEGNVLYRAVNVQDLSERKQLEEQLLQAQKMEAIGRLAGGVAHDFNNLLTIISGYSDVAFRNLSPADPLYADLQGIHNAAQRAAALTRQLLAFSRRQILEFRVVNLNRVLNDLEKMLKRLIGEDIELNVELTPEAGSIKVDPGQLEQVILNLAVNARDAMPQGGRLTIETANVELDESYAEEHREVTPGPHVMLAVSDNGIGMPKEVAPRIFEPFFTTKATGKGTGLGLSTVYGIVKQSGGHIFVYSEPGQGTTFKAYFPRLEEDRPVQAAVKRKAAAGGSETILVVEDEDSVRRLTAQILQRYGYQVIEAANGGEAVLACERHPGGIDLLLTDVVMPHMSGREVAERIRSNVPDMKVIFISGYTDNAIAHHGVLDEGINFLSKPFSAENLAQKVREVLDRTD